MDLYSILREFADSWALLALFAIFIGVILWAFRPGSRAVHEDVSQIPFRHEDRPARAVPAAGAKETGR
ncbi:MAG: cbb3-type cytochrome c oxidase subunit 3 [Paracoccaceae bacterium]|jgi:cytochrome c oxidase cbb3-type subunit IV